MEGCMCEVVEGVRAGKHGGSSHQLEHGEEAWLARERLGWLGVPFVMWGWWTFSPFRDRKYSHELVR